MAEFSGDEVLRAELREQLENYLFNCWQAEWYDGFGPYDRKSDRRNSKFYGALAQEISQKTGGKLMTETLQRFLRGSHTTLEVNLNAICQFLGYASWRDFKSENAASESLRDDVGFLAPVLNKQPSRKIDYRMVAVVLLAFVTLITATYIYQLLNRQSGIPTFTLIHKNGDTTPATYYLGVDLTGFSYDSAYVTFNHQPEGKNLEGDQQKLLISNEIDTLTYISYKPDVIFAQLIMDGEVMSVIRLITYSDDWVGWYDAYLPETNAYWTDPLALPKWYKQNGKLHFKRENIQNLKHRGYYGSHFCSVKDYNVDLSDAEINLNFRNNQENGGISCFGITTLFIDDQGNELNMGFFRVGCTLQYLQFNGEKLRIDFKEIDKISFDTQEWTDLRFTVNGRSLVIQSSGHAPLILTLPKVMGNLIKIKIGFKGSGELNVVDAKDAKGNVYYEDFGEVLTDQMAEIN